MLRIAALVVLLLIAGCGPRMARRSGDIVVIEENSQYIIGQQAPTRFIIIAKTNADAKLAIQKTCKDTQCLASPAGVIFVVERPQ